MASLKLVSVNIEHSQHLDRLKVFFADKDPDIICLQEVLEDDIPLLERILRMPCAAFAPMIHVADRSDPGVVHLSGSAMFSGRTVARFEKKYYVGSEAAARRSTPDSAERNRVVLVCDVEVEDATYRVATTHFTWTPKGEVSEAQREDMRALLAILAPLGEFVLCGDMNAPRVYEGKPGEIFSALSGRYHDNIPLRYETSLDLDLHRAGKLRPHELVSKMVDVLFTTPGYRATDVELHSGVSDHCAVSAAIRTV